MPVFAPTNNPNDTRADTIANAPFFPDISVADFVETTRAQDTITDKRLKHALTIAILETNRELATWRAQQETLGFTTLADVPTVNVGGTSEFVLHYLNAVYCLAKAALLEKFRDVDTTKPDGNGRANEFENTIDDYLAESSNSISAILGRNNYTVELI